MHSAAQMATSEAFKTGVIEERAGRRGENCGMGSKATCPGRFKAGQGAPWHGAGWAAAARCE